MLLSRKISTCAGASVDCQIWLYRGSGFSSKASIAATRRLLKSVDCFGTNRSISPALKAVGAKFSIDPVIITRCPGHPRSSLSV